MERKKKQKNRDVERIKNIQIRASREFVEALKTLDWGTNPQATKRLAKEVIPALQHQIEDKKRKRGGLFDFEP